MKKQFLLIVAMMLPLMALLMLSSCGGSDENSISTENPQTGQKCGENAYYELDTKNRILYIMGSGPMDEYRAMNRAPWYSQKDIISKVEIADGITSIGEAAFENCTALFSVKIPNSITVIGSYAFAYCQNLSSVVIPENVTTVGNFSFSGCSGLTSVTIKNKDTTIQEDTFLGCINLKINIGDETPKYEDPTYTKHDPPQWEESTGGSDSTSPYPCDMTAYVQLPDSLKPYLSNADEIAAFCGSECRGVASRPANDEVWMIRIYGNVGDEISLKYYCAINKYFYNSVEPIVLSNVSHMGTYDEPITVYMLVEK